MTEFATPPRRRTGAARSGRADRAAPNQSGLPARRRMQKKSTSAWAILAGVAFAVAMGLAVYGMTSPLVFSSGSGLLVIPILALLGYLITRGTARREPTFDLGGIMLLGLGLRCIGAFARFRNPVDATIYNTTGKQLANSFRRFDFAVDTGREIPGTGWIRYTTGLFHVFTLDDMYANLLVYTFLSFLGIVLCYQAFVLAVPDGDRKRYALLLFCWPSLIYWPSSIGKEAWMIFGIGLASWGVARAVTGRWLPGITVMAVGLVTLTLVRPHIALMVAVGFGVALLAQPGRRNGLRVAGRAGALIILLIGGMIIAGYTADRLKIDRTGDEGAVDVLEDTSNKTQQGGAAFKAIVVRTPLDYPGALVTVWFRPFPWEARQADQLVTAAETAFLLGLGALSYRRLVRLPKVLARTPYVAYAFTYCLVFVYAFSAIANFGILARQRTQGVILLFVLLSIPKPPQRPGQHDGARTSPGRWFQRHNAPASLEDGGSDAPDAPADPEPPRDDQPSRRRRALPARSGSGRP